MKKFMIRWAVLGLGIIGIIILFFIFKQKRTHKVCQEFEVEFRHNAAPFLSKAEIQEFLERDTIRFIGQQTGSIDLSKIESSLNRNPYIQSADCYIKMDGHLVLDIEQKEPVLRVIPNGRASYYIDSKGETFPLSVRHTANVKVATGHITPSLNTKLYTFISYVNQSTFWNSLIEQIFVRPDGDIVFTTQMGGHEVVVGDNDRLEQKLKKLKKFYQRASTNLGWEKYREINLKFKDQVICKE